MSNLVSRDSIAEGLLDAVTSDGANDEIRETILQRDKKIKNGRLKGIV
jgi:hypothetical protein